MTQANWNNNAIQFPRLISEIEASGAFDLLLPDRLRVIDSVAISMDLDPSEVYELVDRASMEWDSIKLHTFAPAAAGESNG
jgi:hypothetical protein